MLDAWKVPRHIGESKMVLHRLHTAQDSMRPIRCVRALVSMRVMVGEGKEGGEGGRERVHRACILRTTWSELHMHRSYAIACTRALHTARDRKDGDSHLPIAQVALTLAPAAAIMTSPAPFLQHSVQAPKG